MCDSLFEMRLVSCGRSCWFPGSRSLQRSYLASLAKQKQDFSILSPIFFHKETITQRAVSHSIEVSRETPVLRTILCVVKEAQLEDQKWGVWMLVPARVFILPL